MAFRTNDRKKLIPKKKGFKRQLPQTSNDQKDKTYFIWSFSINFWFCLNLSFHHWLNVRFSCNFNLSPFQDVLFCLNFRFNDVVKKSKAKYIFLMVLWHLKLLRDKSIISILLKISDIQITVRDKHQKTRKSNWRNWPHLLMRAIKSKVSIYWKNNYFWSSNIYPFNYCYFFFMAIGHFPFIQIWCWTKRN